EEGWQALEEADVISNGEISEEVTLLEDGDDAGGAGVVGRAEGDEPAVEAYLAGVGCEDAGEDVEEGGLAGAVLADEGVDGAGTQDEGDAAQGHDAGERLADVVEFDGVHGWPRCGGILWVVGWLGGCAGVRLGRCGRPVGAGVRLGAVDTP